MPGSSARIACPAKCGDREDCFIHQERWEPIAGLVIVSNYTICNSCGYKEAQLLVPEGFRVIQERLVCDRCGITYTDQESILSAKNAFESWKELCQKDGVVPRGLSPCPILPCQGELILISRGS